MIKNDISKNERFRRLKEIAEYQLVIMNKMDFIKTLKKMNDSVYVENKNRLNN